MSTSDEEPVEVELSFGSRNLQRRDQAEATHRAEVEPWHYRERGVRGWGVLILFLILAALVGGLLAYVWMNWPASQY